MSIKAGTPEYRAWTGRVSEVINRNKHWILDALEGRTDIDHVYARSCIERIEIVMVMENGEEIRVEFDIPELH